MRIESEIEMVIIRIVDLLMWLSLLAIACVTPYFILYFSIYQIRILKREWRPILAKTIISLIVWLALSLVMFFALFFSFIYGDRFDNVPTLYEEIEVMLILVGLVAVYSLSGWGLYYWVKGRVTNDVKEQNHIKGLV
ncbi:MAG: hypothetical protein AUG51_04140 [Acidobacteria bacterium 13_1_20CM_3_53_8]|nr:MAG: hypothetical protein AUG51_04140 [Acidobacteria bacterium 13_1_20CM_3_53_8]